MDRQTLRDWVIRYNEHGLDGLAGRPRDGRSPKLDAEEKAELIRIVLAGPDPEASGLVLHERGSGAHLQEAVCHQWAVSCASSGFRDKRRGPATRKRTRPHNRPLKRAPALLRKIQCTHKSERIRLSFQDEARIGQKGRTCHIWWKRGEHPPGLCDKRFTFAYVFACVEPGTDNGFALVMPRANTGAMQQFLDHFAATIGKSEHGGHGPRPGRLA
jgi:Homeodomain-like domain